MRPGLSLITALLLAAPASAVPLELQHQGRLLDATGAPLDGTHDVTFGIHDAPAGGAALWTETQGLELDNGYYATHLGADASNLLDEDLFGGGGLFLSLSVDTGAELPTRLPLTSVPFAIRASSAGSVDGGRVSASEVIVNGATVIDASGQISWATIADVPDDLDTLSGLSCADGDGLRFDGSSWGCASAGDHLHDATDVVSGVFDASRLPIGTGAGDVAAGDHTHDASSIISGTLATSRLDVGDGAGQIAAGDHAHTAADVGAMPEDGGTMAGDLTVEGDIALDGDLSAKGGLTSQGGRIRRDFLTWNTTATGTTPIHIKTNIKIKSSIMYRFLVEGYAYGAVQPINSETVGYTYSASDCIHSVRNVNHASGVSISSYCSSDGYVVIKLVPANSYYIGFGVSGWFTNPTGTAWDVSAAVTHQSADL